MPDSIQFREYSRNSGVGGAKHATFEGCRDLPNVWWNGAKRKANHNWMENVGNANDWCLLSRYFLCSPPIWVGGVSVSTFRSHPPSIRPTSSSASESRAYFLLSSALISQATCRKNFSESSFALASRMTGNFLSLFKRLVATRQHEKIPRQDWRNGHLSVRISLC